jgi:hypothetical protein
VLIVIDTAPGGRASANPRAKHRSSLSLSRFHLRRGNPRRPHQISPGSRQYCHLAVCVQVRPLRCCSRPWSPPSSNKKSLLSFIDPTLDLPILEVPGQRRPPPRRSSSHYQKTRGATKRRLFFYWLPVRCARKSRSTVLLPSSSNNWSSTAPAFALPFATMAGLFRRIYDWLLRLFW